MKCLVFPLWQIIHRYSLIQRALDFLRPSFSIRYRPRSNVEDVQTASIRRLCRQYQVTCPCLYNSFVSLPITYCAFKGIIWVYIDRAVTVWQLEKITAEMF